MKSCRSLALSVLLVAGTFAGLAQTSATPPDYAGIGRATVSDMVSGRWSAVEAQFDTRMKAALPSGKLAAAWHRNTAGVGTFEHIRSVKVEELERGSYHVAVVTCDFTRGSIDVKPVINSQGQIAGLFFAPAAPAASAPARQQDYAAIGRETVTALAQGKFASVELRFDPNMKAALPEGRLAAAWQQVTARAGQFEHSDEVQLSMQDGYHVTRVTCTFAHATLYVKVALDPDGRIAGLYFIPSAGE